MTAGEIKLKLTQLKKDAFIKMNIEVMNGFHHFSIVDDSIDIIFTNLINKYYDVKKIDQIDTQTIISKSFMLRI